MLKRRAAIEPTIGQTIGHMKSNNRMDLNYRTGREGDKINALLNAAGYNLRKLLRWVGFAPIFWLWSRLTARLAAENARHRPTILPACD